MGSGSQTALKQALTVRVAQLIPMLSTPVAGEQLATVAAIQRVLWSESLTFHDLARHIAAPPGRVPELMARVLDLASGADWLACPPVAGALRELGQVLHREGGPAAAAALRRAWQAERLLGMPQALPD